MQKTAIFAERLALRRNREGWTQDKLAEESGVSKRSIVDYEAGKTDPGLEQLEKLANALGVRVAFLLGEDGELIETDKESVRLALSALKSQASSLVDQIAFYERQLCSNKPQVGPLEDRTPASRPLNSISVSEAAASITAAERAVEAQKATPSSGAGGPTGNKPETSRGTSKETSGRREPPK